VLRWRLAPGDWRATPDGVAGPFGRLAVTADAPVECGLEQGWESPAYGEVYPVPVLKVQITSIATTITTLMDLDQQSKIAFCPHNYT
jgi:hypothetical protein